MIWEGLKENELYFGIMIISEIFKMNMILLYFIEEKEVPKDLLII